jgi:hypothetical protein
MKLVFPLAYVKAVTNLMLSEGDDQVPAQSLTIEAEVVPSTIDELRDKLSEVFFDMVAGDKAPAVPRLPELAALCWRTEYENGRLELDLTDTEGLAFSDQRLEFQGVDVKAIEFEPLATGMVAIKANAIIRGDEDQRGKLTALLKHTVMATFSKLTQKPLMEPEQPKDDAAQRQEPLALH